MSAETGREVYEAARAREVNRRPADPQGNVAGGPGAVATAARVARSCVCGDTEVVHEIGVRGGRPARTRCTVATADGPCGCTAYRRAHDYGPDGTDLQCQACGIPVLDATGPCEGPS